MLVLTLFCNFIILFTPKNIIISRKEKDIDNFMNVPETQDSAKKTIVETAMRGPNADETTAAKETVEEPIAEEAMANPIEENKIPTAEAVDKFRSLTATRMKAIGQQLFQMKKIPEKRNTDYSREDVDKIFAYLREEIDKCEFLKKFEEKKTNKFDFDFKF